MARTHTAISENGRTKVSAPTEAEAAEKLEEATEAAEVSKNLGGRPRKVRAAMTAAEFETFRTFLLGTVEAAHPEQVPADLEQVPEQYRSIILDNANTARKAALSAAEEMLARFA